MEMYMASVEGLKKIAKVIKKGNPPAGMTREEWMKELADALIESQKEAYDWYRNNRWY